MQLETVENVCLACDSFYTLTGLSKTVPLGVWKVIIRHASLRLAGDSKKAILQSGSVLVVPVVWYGFRVRFLRCTQAGDVRAPLQSETVVWSRAAGYCSGAYEGAIFKMIEHFIHWRGVFGSAETGKDKARNR